MGRAIRGTTVKAEGQAGPLGKGVPLTKAAGPGGLIEIAGGKRAVQSPQVPGFKGLMGRATAAGGIRTPQQSMSPFARFIKTGRAKGRFGPQVMPTSRRGLFRNAFSQNAPAPTPTKLPQGQAPGGLGAS